ncbi:capsid protein [Rose yellow vein virus]|uniref:Coat protein n=1 Tax=Rose yellow vein virus TaxID=1213588 RepID=I7CAR7_9VIRU|nr:capsid protein [Rose yellow vein virus]AFO54490.1 capsid protein [Rose yellow vein virus]
MSQISLLEKELARVSFKGEITKINLESRRNKLDNDFETISIGEITELSVLNSILGFPLEYGLDKIEDVQVNEINEMDTLEQEVQALTIGQDKQSSPISESDPESEEEIYVLDDMHKPRTKPKRKPNWSRHRDEKIWQSRRSPNLGEDLNRAYGSHEKSLPNTAINDKGIILYCDNPSTQMQEIDAWEAAMDIAVGLHPQWTAQQRLAYAENTFQGTAKLAWNAFKGSINFTNWYNVFIASGGLGKFITSTLRLEICGIESTDEEKLKLQEKAKHLLQTLRLCDISMLDKYNVIFTKLYWIAGEVTNLETLNSYFSKLPPPFNEKAKKEYVSDEKDTIGKRVRHVQNILEQYCFERRLANVTKQSVKAICAKHNPPNLDIGCRQERSVFKHKRKRKFSKKSFRKISKNRFSKKKKKKPFFKKKRKGFKPKDPKKVKCFGCQQIGHYANKCPNKKGQEFKSKVQSIEQICGFILAQECEESASDSEDSYYELISSSSDSE